MSEFIVSSGQSLPVGTAVRAGFQRGIVVEADPRAGRHRVRLLQRSEGGTPERWTDISPRTRLVRNQRLTIETP